MTNKEILEPVAAIIKEQYNNYVELVIENEQVILRSSNGKYYTVMSEKDFFSNWRYYLDEIEKTFCRSFIINILEQEENES